ncbi:hypothetical protein BAE44_0000441 [Dichanthelium oligosanthes]|uniref:Exocyst subunit Exo70 family protein n=1 Tax=Dichanthelium oligosanthes TaxID=888268 RepID=A0A1E5WMD1_9POAL|nr:hypothetical protein BAE44_0000441 [Dichanthelium oligosanthes]
MVAEFLRVRVWNSSSRLRVAVHRLSLASSSVSLPSAAADKTSSVGTGGDVDASHGSRSRASSAGPDEVAALLDDGESWDELDLICPAGVSLLHAIALRVNRAGCTMELFRAFSKAPCCDVIDGFLSILRVECSQQTTEAMIKLWTTVAKLIEKAVAAMRRQLYAQNSGAFDGFRDEYLMAVARILILLEFANGYTNITSHEKLIYILGILERNLQANIVVTCADAGVSRHLFLANNISFILNRAADADDVACLLGDVWAARRRRRLEQHVESYVESSWGPVVAFLETSVSAWGRGCRIALPFFFLGPNRKRKGAQISRPDRGATLIYRVVAPLSHAL